MRHFRALTRKNWINWKRTPVSSLLEIIFPVLLMGVLVFLRHKIPLREISEDQLKKLLHPLFPVVDFNFSSYNSSYITLLHMASQEDELVPFFKFYNYTNVNGTLIQNITR